MYKYYKQKKENIKNNNSKTDASHKNKQIYKINSISNESNIIINKLATNQLDNKYTTKNDLVSSTQVSKNAISVSRQTEFFIPNIIDNINLGNIKQFKEEDDKYVISKLNINNNKQFKSKEDSFYKTSINNLDNSINKVKASDMEYIELNSKKTTQKNLPDNLRKTTVTNNKLNQENNINKSPNIENKIDHVNNTLLELVYDIKDPNKSTILNNINYNSHNNNENGSIFLPINVNDIEEELLKAEAGYMEEDDEDLKSSEISGELFGFDKDKNNINKIIKGISSDEDNKNNKSLNENNTNNNTKLYLENKLDIENILFPKSNYGVNPNNTYKVKTIIIQNEVCNINYNKEKINNSNVKEVVDPEIFLVILKFLYNELHNGLIELSDNFTEERRKYFDKDFNSYITILNFYLKSKEEFFLGVLSQIMSKLSISQILLDNSFTYYINEAHSEDALIKSIQHAYDKVYKAGEKYSIAPRIITKLRLKNILQFQFDCFRDIKNNYADLKPEVMEIIVIDKVYAEYGFDKEAVRAAINKHNIHNDSTFEDILKKLNEFKNESFLNI